MSLSEAVHKDVIEHQLREMVSNKELGRLVARKDEKTGKMQTEKVTVRAIVSLVMSSTNYQVNPENSSRAFVIYADESKEQTQRIHAAQRQKYTIERHQARKELMPQLIRKHHSAQRLLKNYAIINGFARYLTFPDDMMRSRRDNERFIDLIAAVCHLRQYQKEVKEKGGILCIECDLKDYEIARHIMVESVLSVAFLGLPHGAYTVYEMLRKYVRKRVSKLNISAEEIEVNQRELREFSGLGHSFIKQYLRLLVEYEYVIKCGGHARGSRPYYRLKKDESINSFGYEAIPEVEEIRGKLNR